MHYHSLLYLPLKDDTDLPKHLNLGFSISNCRVRRLNHTFTRSVAELGLQYVFYICCDLYSFEHTKIFVRGSSRIAEKQVTKLYVVSLARYQKWLM